MTPAYQAEAWAWEQALGLPSGTLTGADIQAWFDDIDRHAGQTAGAKQ